MLGIKKKVRKRIEPLSNDEGTDVESLEETDNLQRNTIGQCLLKKDKTIYHRQQRGA